MKAALHLARRFSFDNSYSHCGFSPVFAPQLSGGDGQRDLQVVDERKRSAVIRLLVRAPM